MRYSGRIVNFQIGACCKMTKDAIKTPDQRVAELEAEKAKYQEN
jgi:hypothetical protein